MSEENNQQVGNLFDDFGAVTYEKWQATAEVALKGAPFEKKMFTKTYEEIVLKPIYRAVDLGDASFANTTPGSAPFVRSGRIDGYIEKPWLIAQECNHADASELNSVLKNELNRGLQAVHIHLDSASQLSVDPDGATLDQIGDAGLSLSTTDDLAKALAEVDFGKIPLRVHAGISAVPFIATLGAVAKARKVNVKSINGCIGADPIGMLAQNGELPVALTDLYDQMATTILWAEKNAPLLRTAIVDISCYSNAGANAVQELAYAISTAVEYAKEMEKRGIAFAVTAKHLQFALSLGANMFMELAKVRAVRLAWSQVCAAYNASNTDCAANIHVQTSYFTKTIYDPYVNLLRATTESFAGAVGGVDSMHVGTFDEVVRKGDETSRRIARNIQIMLQEECNLTQPIDPAGGSWYIESITEDLARRAWNIFREIEGAGGIIIALQKGMPQEEVEKVSKKRIAALSTRGNVVVGTNMYANLGEKLLEAGKSKFNADYRKKAVADYRKNNSGNSKDTLSALATKSGEESLKFAIEAATAGATIGEISKALQKNNVLPKIMPLNLHRNAEVFEKLRGTTEAYTKKTGNNVRVFLANMGPIPQHKARADFSRGFFEVGAFDVITNTGFELPDEAVNAAIKEKSDVVVICSTDKTYPELVPSLATLLKKKLPKAKIVLAGMPAAEFQQSYVDAGVDEFIHVKADCYKILSDLQQRKGMTA